MRRASCYTRNKTTFVYRQMLSLHYLKPGSGIHYTSHQRPECLPLIFYAFPFRPFHTLPHDIDPIKTQIRLTTPRLPPISTDLLLPSTVLPALFIPISVPHHPPLPPLLFFPLTLPPHPHIHIIEIHHHPQESHIRIRLIR